MQPLKDSSNFKRVVLFQKSVWREQEQAHLRSLKVQVYLLIYRQARTDNKQEKSLQIEGKGTKAFSKVGALEPPECQNALSCDSFVIVLVKL
jgi:hypothetical protein